MPTKIYIPAQAVLESQSKDLDLAFPARCSRCDRSEAMQRESHWLHFRTGIKPGYWIYRKFQTDVRFELHLPLCERCYAENFLENPDSCEHDETGLGVTARWRSAGIWVATILGGAAFILLMKVIPLPEGEPWFNWLWLILIGTALFLFVITLAGTEVQNQKIRTRLGRTPHDLQWLRAEVSVSSPTEELRERDPAVTVLLQNEDWAESCAAHYGWKFETIRPESVEAK